MAGRFLNGVVLVLVLGLGLTSSYVIDDDPYLSEKEMQTIDDVTDEIEKLDENARNVDNKQLQADASEQQKIDTIVSNYNTVADECKEKGKSKIEALEKKVKGLIKGKSKHHYQDLIHLAKSIAGKEDLLAALKSEACSSCGFENVCEIDAVLNVLGIDSNLPRRRRIRECKVAILQLSLAGKLFPPTSENVQCDVDDPFRTFNGRCNNLGNPLFGSTGGEFRRLVIPDYGDCVSTLRKPRNESNDLPNPRQVSRVAHFGSEERDTPESRSLTHLAMNFAQFLDHDITLAEAQGLDCEPYHAKFNPECINIEVPKDDVCFKEREVNFFELERDAPHRPSEDCQLIPRGHSNAITAHIDTSNVYGSSEEEAANLRESNGLLRVMKHPRGCPFTFKNLMPAQDPDLFCVSKNPDTPCFVAGDERANENPGLISVHTIFVREHNRIATIFNEITDWDGERIFQETRRILAASFQKIVYSEFLPAVLSKKTIREHDLKLLKGNECFDDYDPTLNDQMSTAFSVAAYRFGHSLIRDEFSRLSQDGLQHNCDKSAFLKIPVLDFGNPIYVYDTCQGGLDSIYRGLVGDAASKIDGQFASAVIKFLSRGEGDSSDLLAINLQRGRERGVPGYVLFHNQVCGIRPRINVQEGFDGLKAAGFTDEQIANYKIVYDDVRDIDLFSGGMHEPPGPDGGLLGPTFQCIIAEQFKRLKFGDRFWHENCKDDGKHTTLTAFNKCQLAEIRKANLAKIICSNADDIPSITKSPLQQSSLFVPCCELPEIDLEKYVKCFKEKVPVVPSAVPVVHLDSAEWA